KITGVYSVGVGPTGKTFVLVFESQRLRFPIIFPLVLLRIPRLVLLEPTEMELEPVTRLPLFKIRLLTVKLELSVTPDELLIVKLFTVDGNPFPVTCDELPLYI